MILTNDDVQEILRLIDASFFDELHLETRDFKLSLRRTANRDGVWTHEVQTVSSANLVSRHDKPVQASSITEEASSSEATSSTAGLVDILPPMIGTFYRCPKPGAPPFVEIGSRVEANTVVGIIETMKLMNPVTAHVHGVVAEICAADGELVNADRVLMRLCQETA